MVTRKRLSQIAAEIHGAHFAGASDPEITSVEYDSRRVQPGSLFVAIPGLKTDGTAFIRDAQRSGAAAVLTTSADVSPTLPCVLIPNARKALAEAAWAFFDHPERQLITVGITGTNGKTTTASLLKSLLEFAGHRAGMIGTLGVFYEGTEADSPRTTPESSDLAAHFAHMVDLRYTHVVMEATSIGIDLERVWGIPFRVAVFTNLTRDHLDYHGTVAAYLAAKVRLFEELPAQSVGIVNVDDSTASHFLSAVKGQALSYAIEQSADYRAANITLARDAVHFTLRSRHGESAMRVPLIGRFNVYNVLAVIAVADALNIPMETIRAGLAVARPVRGRAEIVPLQAPFTVVVDYAHTPDALEKILSTLRALNPSRIITVVGAGGDRDRGKRPLMAEVSVELSDLVILTSDNPRSEDPEAILNDMEAGLPKSHSHLREADRRRAIARALRDARAGDIVLIAGKGHETYQEIQGVKHPFDDRDVAIEEFTKLGERP